MATKRAGRTGTPKKGIRGGLVDRQRAKRVFLEAYSKLGNLTLAAQAASIIRSQHYKWLKGDKEYAEAFASAHNEALDLLEAEARRRAVEGCDRPVFYKGDECGAIREYSDTLLIFLLKGGRPEKFRERFEHTGKDGSPLPPGVLVVPLAAGSTEWAEIAQVQQRQLAEQAKVASETT